MQFDFAKFNHENEYEFWTDTGAGTQYLQLIWGKMVDITPPRNFKINEDVFKRQYDLLKMEFEDIVELSPDGFLVYAMRNTMKILSRLFDKMPEPNRDNVFVIAKTLEDFNSKVYGIIDKMVDRDLDWLYADPST